MLSTSKKMLQFKWSRAAQAANAERLKLQRDLYAFTESIPHGLAYKPVAMAFDDQLSLLAISNKHGALRIYGAPGVELHASLGGDELNEDEHICQIEWARGRGQLVTVSNNFKVRLWTINDSSIECTAVSETFSSEQKQITTCAIVLEDNLILVGTTEGGNIYSLHLDSLESAPVTISQEAVLANVQEELRNRSHGDVEVIKLKPDEPRKILIGYSRGLLVLWDRESVSVQGFYNASQQLESICWSGTSTFISSHNDGSYISWNLSDDMKPESPPNTPYGPHPCKSIGKILHTSVDEQDLVIFSGGLPRTVHGKQSISLFIGDHSRALDFTSKVVDFTLIHEKALAIVLEEEFIVIDLSTTSWLPFNLPYLSCIHSSAITTCQHYSSIPQELYSKIHDAGQKNQASRSPSPWPITGGKVELENIGNRDVLLTGHEDGSVRFWDVTTSCMTLLYEHFTSKYFRSDDDLSPLDNDNDDQQDNDDEWPPFKKVGSFDPYSDDPRLSVRKLFFCVDSGTLVVAGTAGQVVILVFRTELSEKSITSQTINIVEDKDGFVWKGHNKLPLKTGIIRMEPGFQPISFLQLTPPAGISAVMIQTNWHYISVGTAHGFALFDYEANKIIISKCTLSPVELNSQDSALISRRKSFKKSLRESFRRLRRGRSTRGVGATTKAADRDNEPALRPVERGIEATPKDCSLLSLVKCILIAPATLSHSIGNTPTLWVGTGGGVIYVYAVQGATCQLSKEINLRHGAPVVFMSIMDSKGSASNCGENEENSHLRILICSEEQYKIFSLPSLKPTSKFKLTAHEGSRARVMRPATFVSSSDPEIKEVAVMVATNDGQVAVHSLVDLKRQIVAQCVKPEDKIGISTLVFTSQGEGFYLHSPCEFQRFSLSCTKFVKPTGVVEIPIENRPTRVVPSGAGGDSRPASLREGEQVATQNARDEDANPAANPPCPPPVAEAEPNGEMMGGGQVANGVPPAHQVQPAEELATYQENRQQEVGVEIAAQQVISESSVL